MAHFICVGKIIAAHGIKGYVKISSFTEDPSTIKKFEKLYSKDGKQEVNVRVVSMQKNIAIAQVGDITDRNEAEKLRHTELFVPRDALPEPNEGGFYWEDLIGLKAELEDGSVYGKVIAMHNFGAGDVIEIYCEKAKKTEMFAFNEQTIPSIDVAGGKLTLCLPEIVMVSSQKTVVTKSKEESSDD